MANILIQGMELPKNADEHITIGYNRLGELTAVKVVWNGMSWAVVEETKAVMELADKLLAAAVVKGENNG